jgi:hypothetical protein
MIQYYPTFVVSIVLLLALGCSSEKSSLPPEAAHALADPDGFELISLEPNLRLEDNYGFHGWKILGKTVIKTLDSQQDLITSFEGRVAQSNGNFMQCFNPRHGINVKHDNTIYEFGGGFECHQVQWYINGMRTKGVPDYAFTPVNV